MARRDISHTPKDIVEALLVTAEVSVKGGPHEGHLATLLGQRKAGSQWGTAWCPMRASDYVDPPWEPVSYAELPMGTTMPLCEYYNMYSPHFLLGSLEIIAALNALPEEVQAGVSVLPGPHGWDLCAPRGYVLPRREAQEAWLILGPVSREDGRLMVYTSYPGRLLASLPPSFNGDVTTLDFSLPYAVKQLV